MAYPKIRRKKFNFFEKIFLNLIKGLGQMEA